MCWTAQALQNEKQGAGEVADAFGMIDRIYGYEI